MTRLYVVVAKGLGVVLHVVDDLCGNIGFFRLDEVGIVACWLSLQNVAILQQDDVVAIALALALDIRTDTSHRSLHGTTLGEVVRKERSVNVGGLYQSDCQSFPFCHHSHADAQECKNRYRLFHKYVCV